MKPVREMSRPELREAAFCAIRDALGSDGLDRFIVEFVPAAGVDYTRDRHKWLPRFQSMGELGAAVRVWEAEGDSPFKLRDGDASDGSRDARPE